MVCMYILCLYPTKGLFYTVYSGFTMCVTIVHAKSMEFVSKKKKYFSINLTGKLI